MKSVKYLNIYVILVIYTIINLIVEELIPTIFNLIINPLILILLTIYLYNKTENNHGRFVKNKEYIKKMVIISLMYIILYVLLGFIFGFVTSPYSHEFLIILKNIWQIVVPIICLEYIRSALLNRYSKGKFYIIILTVLFITLELNIKNFINSLSNIESAYKYISSIILPLVFAQIIYTYLSLKGSYKIVLVYRLIVEMMFLLSPIYPNLDWFLTGIIGILMPVIIYILYKFDYDKKENKISRYKSKQKPITYIPFLSIIILFVLFMVGLFPHEPIAIISNSMNPIFNRGDVVVFRKLDEKNKNSIEKNTIIVYNIDSQYIVHRVVDIIKKDGDVYFQTKGDANISVDLELVSTSQIIGIYQFSIKYIGYPSVWLSEISRNEEAKVEIK